MPKTINMLPTVSATKLAEKIRLAEPKARAKKAKKPAAKPSGLGKTALVLSGGGSRGAYEIGVWQALREMGVRIDIVCGTSIGAMNSAVIAQDAYETAVKLWTELETHMVFDFKSAVENKGVKFTGIRDILAKNLSEEAVRRSPIDMGIVTVNFPSMDPLYIWKEQIPNGELMDYVLASCSCFPVVTPYEIQDKKFLDGGYYDYIPIRLALDRGADRIIAVNLKAVGVIQKQDMDEAKDRLTMIECHWDLGAFVIFDTENAKHIMRLGYLDTLKAFKAFDGRRYAFIKGELDKASIRAAEQAAAAFELNPEHIYTRKQFLELLSQAISRYEDGEDLGVKSVRSGLKKLTIENLGKSMDKVSALGKRASLLSLCDILKKQGYAYNSNVPEGDRRTPLIPLTPGIKKLLGDDLAAALWLIKNDLA